MSRVALRRARPLVGLAVIACAIATAGCTGDPPTAAVNITVTRGNCGSTWQPPAQQPATFQIHNAGTVTAEVDLIDPATGGVYAEVESLAPNTSHPMRVRLGRAAYAFKCLGEDTDAVTGPTVRISTGTAPAPAVAPITNQDLTDSVNQYRAYVTTGLGTLATRVDGLRTALRSGNLGGARAAWLAAHLQYERLGAAYDTFDDFADKVDGLPDSLPDGVHDPDFAGLRRIEYGLWHGESLPALAKVADQLATDVAGLRRAFPDQQTDPNDLPLRAHEILENALQFELTGDSDQGSGTSLATVDANLAGTRAVLDALAPQMSSRYRAWTATLSYVDRTTSLVDSFRPDGGWTPVGALSAVDRQRLNGTIGQLLEMLAPIAAIGDVRRTS
jgi:iron uptake system EfeUOB component EfeO/EfeM